MRCRHFVQNAWKKDLCSNCFKSKDEHVLASPARPPPQRLSAPPPQGILKGSWSTTRSKKAHKVYFPAEESEVIGEGGEDAGPPSDEDEDHRDEDWKQPVAEDDPQEREDERLLQALTRSNTDFNSVAANLEATAAHNGSNGTSGTTINSNSNSNSNCSNSSSNSSSSSCKPRAPLQLGRPLTDAEGRRQTLLVSVQPFKPSATDPHVTKIPVATPPAPTASNGGVVLKSIVHTLAEDELPPLGVQQREEVDAKGKDVIVTAVSPAAPAPAPLKLNDAQVTATAAAATATAPSSKLSSKHMFLKSIVEPAVTASPPVTPVTTMTITTTSASSTPRREGKRTHITRGTPISKNNELLLKTKFIPLRTSTILGSGNNNNINSNSNISSNNKRNLSDTMNGHKTKQEPVILIDSKSLDSSDEDDRTYTNVQVKTTRLEPELEGVQTKRLSSLLAPLAPGVGSRELAGEPDGRADPDSSSESGSEPPALPQSPPPAVDPRPSFLHGLTARLAPGPAPGPSPTPPADKPRVPFKSSTVVQAASAASAHLQRWSHADAKARTEPPQAPTCSPPSTPPQGQLESCSRSQKRQAPQPPQEVYASSGSSGSSSGGGSGSSSPSSTPVKEPSSALFLRSAALGRAVSTEESSPASSPCSRAPRGTVSAAWTAKQDKRRSLAALAARSESVPAGLGGLGHSVTLGAHSGHSIAQALAQANSFVSMSPAVDHQTPPPPWPHPAWPQPSPRRALSLSSDSLSSGSPGSPGSPASPTKHVISYDTERKKMGTKVRFSLRKFLGLSKDIVREGGLPGLSGLPGSLAGAGGGGGSQAELSGTPPQPPQPRPRPRLEIIHPSDLNGTAVEVLRGSGVEVRRQLQEAAEAAAAATRRHSDTALGLQPGPAAPATPAAPPTPNPAAPPVPPPTAQDHSEAVKARPSKPPPPPRSQSLETDRLDRPCRPPPPKSADLLLRRPSPSATTPSTTHSVYANIGPVAGEVRSTLAPLKPQRTGSVRDAAAEGPRRTPLDQGATAVLASNKLPAPQTEDSGYESVELSDSTQPQSMTDSENVYECVNGPERSSSPECDSKRKAVSGDYQPMSSFCGSETESDIYSPYSFYGSEEGDEGAASWKWRSRARKGRSVVHKSMEDNYGAVVGANHEALAQLLEQIRTGPAVPAALRPLKALPSLSWGDFTLDGEVQRVTAGRWSFLPAQWGLHAVTLGVLPGGHPGRGRTSLPFALLPVTEFNDLVPTACLPDRHPTSHVKAYVGVLARARVDTLSSYGAWLSGASGAGSGASSGAEEAVWRDAGLALLQLVNALLALQAQATERLDQDCVVFLRDPASLGSTMADNTAQLALLHGDQDSEEVSRLCTLCECALAGVKSLLCASPPAPPAALLCSLLAESGPEALPRAKAVLEFWLWGPALAPVAEQGDSSESPEALQPLQRWLDLERATVLHRLVCARAAAGPSHRLAIPQQSHLLFLVHTSAKDMCGASHLLSAQGVTPLENTV